MRFDNFYVAKHYAKIYKNIIKHSFPAYFLQKSYENLSVVDSFRVHVVPYQAIFCHFCIFCAWLPIVAVWVDADSSAWHKFSPYLYVFWIHQFDKVFHDDVDTIFVKVSVVAETEKVELEALAFHHLHIRYVADVDCGEVWLSCDGAETCEFRAVELYPVVVALVFVVKRFKH